MSEGEAIEAELAAILERDDPKPFVPHWVTQAMHDHQRASNERVRALAAWVENAERPATQ